MSRYSVYSQTDHEEQEGMHIQIGKEQRVGIQGAEVVFKCTLHDATKAVPRLQLTQLTLEFEASHERRLGISLVCRGYCTA